MDPEFDPPLLHVWGQPYEHQPLLIVVNRAGLLALRSAVDNALSATMDASMQAIVKGPGDGPMTRDGEHYDIVIWRDDTDWQGERWGGLGFPYTDIDYLDCNPPDLIAYPINIESEAKTP